MSKFDQDTAGRFYGEHQGKPFFNGLMNFITSDAVTGIELVAENAI